MFLMNYKEEHANVFPSLAYHFIICGLYFVCNQHRIIYADRLIIRLETFIDSSIKPFPLRSKVETAYAPSKKKQECSGYFLFAAHQYQSWA